MEQVKKWIVPFGVILAVLLGGFSLWKSSSAHNVAYVRMEELYNSFVMKQQLEKKLKDTEQARTMMLDSARIKLQLMNNDLKQLPKADTASLLRFDQQQKAYFSMKQQFDEDNEMLAKQYTDQIWTQINQYTKDFGKEKGYDFILGASGDGVLMYADEGKDITEQMKTYINEKYQGKLK
jgi:outer membrane protein